MTPIYKRTLTKPEIKAIARKEYVENALYLEWRIRMNCPKCGAETSHEIPELVLDMIEEAESEEE